MTESSHRRLPRRWLRSLVAALLGLVLVMGFPLREALARPIASTPLQSRAASFIPITEQPFYPELQATARRWLDAPLSHVVGESPRETLLNFYAVMALVQQEIKAATAQPLQDPGLRWSAAVRARISNATSLFGLAQQALDPSPFPKSVRDDLLAGTAIQLKEVLDYVFTHSVVPITIPDSAQLKQLNNERSKASESWTLPLTSITLSSAPADDDRPPGFVFSAATVKQVGRMHAEIEKLDVVDQPFATPSLYEQFIYTPGYLSSPKWYLKLPARLRQILAIPFADQTLLQILATLLTLVVYVLVLVLLLRRLLRTYRYMQPGLELKTRPWHYDNKAWYRVLLVLPIMPMTRLSEVFIDQYVNFSGWLLVIITYLLYILYFTAASVFFFYLFEAVGRSASETLVTLRGGNSELQLRRISNLVMPVSRVLGMLVAFVMVYRLLIVLGLPPATVLAFSAVPGLAIGLGASKLLGNLFAGLSIQTDRPVRVGEFCRIGDNLGFVTRIGLRSMELQTLESRVTIPNAIADEETIINYSRRSENVEHVPMQSLDVRLEIDERLAPEQVDDLLLLVRRHVEADPAFQDPLVSIEQASSGQLTLICFAMVSLHEWTPYLEARERLLKRLHELVTQVALSTITFGVSYDTTAEQLRQLPQLIAAVVHADADFALQSCRLMSIGDFAYNIVVRLRGAQASLGAFKDAIDGLNQRLLIALAEAGIEIPFPTAVEISRHT